MDKPYTVGKWHEQNNYKCNLCPHASTSEAVAIAHHQARHVTRPTPPPPSPILVADKSGKEVKPTVTLDELAEETLVPEIIKAIEQVEAEQIVDEALAKATDTVMESEPAKKKPPAKRTTKKRSVTNG